MMRVPLGTRVAGTLHNTLKQPLIVFGLGARRGFSDSVVIAPGATKQFAFTADRAGAFMYAARTHVDPLFGRDPTEQQLNGAIIVDRPNAPADRVFGITWHLLADPKSPTGINSSTMTLNGRAWPHTERLSYTQGDSVHWRVLNFTEYDHPMHLHGFYFRIDSRSDGPTDTLYTAAQQRMAVTEPIQSFQAVSLSWKAERPGNWVFHCHYAIHISDYVTVDEKNGKVDAAAQSHHQTNAPHQMYGLVLGITVAPKGPQLVAAAPERRIRIEQRERPSANGKPPAMAFAITSGGSGRDTATLPIPGPTLVLERGKRVEVTIVNRSHEHAAVHWHGIELESYPDGVPGWSGSTGQILPSIAPSESLVVRWTPPRAGSFMYHSHFNEMRQMGSGLFGPIIVLEPGERYDPETDRTLFFGNEGYVKNLAEDPPKVTLNGRVNPEPMVLKANTKYRLRFFSLAGDAPTEVHVMRGAQEVEWRAVAKDGYPLPLSQAITGPARLTIDPGEIFDFELTPKERGELTLSFGLPQPPPPPPAKPGQSAPPPPPVPPLTKVAIHVR
jgi:FtsP/CotA-like multicopper oxidase with cupredoxin domain